MVSSPERPDLPRLKEGGDEFHHGSLVWTWIPAANERPKKPLFKKWAETEPWVTWDVDDGEMHAEERVESAPGLNDSRAPCDDC